MCQTVKGRPPWVMNAIRHGRMVRAAKGALLRVLPVLAKAEKPMTAGEIARTLGMRGDPSTVHHALCLLHRVGMLKTNRVPARLHPFASMECEWYLKDLDEVINQE
jgi:predicted transcriptional regulator